MREKREGRGSVNERNGKKRGGEREGRGEASPLRNVVVERPPWLVIHLAPDKTCNW